MSAAIDDSLLTRQTLLSRLRDLEDRESWQTFFDRYWRLIYNVARCAGLDDGHASDVVQETVLSVAQKMPGFCYDPERGSFKQWLLRITRRRIVDHQRRIYREPTKAEVSIATLEDDDQYGEAITNPSERQIEDAWEEEWKKAIFEAALAIVRNEVNPKYYQVFDYAVLKGWPVSKVAATLDMSAAQVYLAKHRVSQAVKKRARKLAMQRARDF